MKISEFNKPSQPLQESEQLDELALSSFVGDFGAAAIKSLFTGKGLKHQMIQDMFLKDFYEDGITSLENAIKGGLVDPKIRGTDLGSGAADSGSTEAGVDPAAVEPAAGEPGAAPAAGAAKTAGGAAAYQAQQQTSQNINNYVKQAAQAINSTTDKNQKIALTKELVNAMADRQGTPEWNNTVKGVEGIIKGAGTDPSFASAAIGNLRAGKTMSEAWRIYFANKLVEAVGLTWKDLGLSVLKEGKTYYIAESKYLKLNNLFENIVNLTEDDGKQSISQYMLNWFNQYMQGVNWQPQKQLILGTLQDMENTYPKGYKDKIKTLAKTAFALSKSSTAMPIGMKDELSKMKDPNAQAAAQAAGKQPATQAQPEGGKLPLTVDELKAGLEQLAADNPEEYNNLVTTLKPVPVTKAGAAPAAPAAPAGGTAPKPAAPTAPAPKTTTAESRRRR